MEQPAASKPEQILNFHFSLQFTDKVRGINSILYVGNSSNLK